VNANFSDLSLLDCINARQRHGPTRLKRVEVEFKRSPDVGIVWQLAEVRRGLDISPTGKAGCSYTAGPAEGLCLTIKSSARVEFQS
jgi:hypothetical protein